MDKYYIYEIFCKKTEFSYYGMTKYFLYRVGQHFRDLAKNRHYNKFFQRDYNRYGGESFTFALLDMADEKVDAQQVERVFIEIGLQNQRCYNIMMPIEPGIVIRKCDWLRRSKRVCQECGKPRPCEHRAQFSRFPKKKVIYDFESDLRRIRNEHLVRYGVDSLNNDLHHIK